MHFRNLILFHFLGGALAVPTSDTPAPGYGNVDISGLAFPPPTKIIVVELNGTLSEVEVKMNNELATRQFKQDYLYGPLFGWLFYIGFYTLQDFRDTSWILPRDGPSIGYIADQVASSIRRQNGSGRISVDVGGGWSYIMNLTGEGYQFQTMDYGVMYFTVYQAILGANDWIVNDNGVSFSMLDSNRHLIFTLQILPTNHDNNSVDHDEFKRLESPIEGKIAKYAEW